MHGFALQQKKSEDLLGNKRACRSHASAAGGQHRGPPKTIAVKMILEKRLDLLGDTPTLCRWGDAESFHRDTTVGASLVLGSHSALWCGVAGTIENFTGSCIAGMCSVGGCGTRVFATVVALHIRYRDRLENIVVELSPLSSLLPTRGRVHGNWLAATPLRSWFSLARLGLLA